MQMQMYILTAMLKPWVHIYNIYQELTLVNPSLFQGSKKYIPNMQKRLILKKRVGRFFFFNILVRRKSITIVQDGELNHNKF